MSPRGLYSRTYHIQNIIMEIFLVYFWWICSFVASRNGNIPLEEYSHSSRQQNCIFTSRPVNIFLMYIYLIMNSPNGVKSGFLERVSISCPTCGTRHDLYKITGNQSYAQLVNRPFNICDTEVSNLWIRSVWPPYNFRKVVWNLCE